MAMMGPSGGGRRSRGRGRLMSDINVTPMVDVMLVLLVIFMVTAPLIVLGEPVNLAKTNSQQLPPSKSVSLSVTVNANGDIFVGGERTPIAPDALGEKLIAISETGLEDRILVRGDKDADYGAVVAVLALVREAGFANVGLVTNSTSSSNGKNQ